MKWAYSDSVIEGLVQQYQIQSAVRMRNMIDISISFRHKNDNVRRSQGRRRQGQCQAKVKQLLGAQRIVTGWLSLDTRRERKGRYDKTPLCGR
ncbi:hypothetical protein LSTR_LSTR001618 [Laodelphax striatellus]|uniref:Uncharacterized protein n=1 Tax=Laodelphax striatellus TaxID=195883 RepID=A0A482XCE2_LAOST|nr:hypothetical protein LSTR_LSTR016286 [Laodelphax striatellus]RZF43357.1 hypothetical protein LSTR_LSTR001618 [Laodelphax striatellus]